MTTINRTALVSYSTAQMYALVADIPSYPRFLPWCAAARILAHEDNVVVAALDVHYGGLRSSFTTRNVLQQDQAVDMELVDGPFSRLSGRWRFDALQEQGCKISLELDFTVSKGALYLTLTPVFSRIANQMVGCFHRRADQLYGART